MSRNRQHPTASDAMHVALDATRTTREATRALYLHLESKVREAQEQVEAVTALVNQVLAERERRRAYFTQHPLRCLIAAWLGDPDARAVRGSAGDS
jgi:DNA-dependent RNA polymerase auxiliary subunit epsilon